MSPHRVHGVKNPGGAATPLLASILEELGQQIISGDLPEGRTFTLQDISDRFGISRTVARETMRALEQMGLVASSRRVGITVLPRESWAAFDPTVIQWRLASAQERAGQLRALTELRIAVEPIAAFNAAKNASDAQRAEIVELAATLRSLGESDEGASDEFLSADIRFHQLLLEASGNDMFIALAPVLVPALQGRTQFGLQPAAPVQVAMDSHDALARAIAENRPEDAEAAARELLIEVREALQES